MNTTDELLAALERAEESAQTMYTEAAMLRHEVRVVDEKRARMWVPIALMTVVLGVTLLVAKQNSDNGQLLIECTVPSSDKKVHECYDRAQESQGRAVGEINLTAIFVAECALEGVTPPLTPCVEKKVLAYRQAQRSK